MDNSIDLKQLFIKGYKSKHFKLYELVSPEVFDKYGERAWQFFDPLLLVAMDLLYDDLRELTGAITVNNWKWDGAYKESGLRSLTYGSADGYSLHKLGKAMDMKFAKFTAEQIRTHIFNNKDRYWMIKGVELKTPTWVHIDTRNVDTETSFFKFNP